MKRLIAALAALVLLRGDMFQDASNAKLPAALNNLGMGSKLASDPLCTMTTGSAAITACNSTAGIEVGMIVSATGLPSGTKVSGGITATGFTMSAPATASFTGSYVHLRPPFFAEIDGAEPPIVRVPGRLMVGSAVGRTDRRTQAPGDNLDWCPTVADCPQWAPRDASLVVMSPIGSHAIVGMSRASLSTQPPLTGSTIALAGVAIKDTVDINRPAWASYLHVTHKDPSLGSHSWGAEISIKNQGVNGISTPYWEASGPTGIALRGTDDTSFGGNSLYPGNTAILVARGVDNPGVPQGWNKGIVFQSDAITGNDGTTGVGVAIEMARGHLIQWTPPNNTVGAYITSEVTTSAKQQSIHFTDYETNIKGQAQQQMLRVTDRTGGVAGNNLRIFNSVLGDYPTIASEGADAAVPIVISPKGTGYVYVTAPIRTFGYTVSTLPAGTVGMRAYVTDQLTTCAQIGATLTGGGAKKCPVFHDGSAWVGG